MPDAWDFWEENYAPIPEAALFPDDDIVKEICDEVKDRLYLPEFPSSHPPIPPDTLQEGLFGDRGQEKQRISFTTYHPKEIMCDIWYNLLSYIHLDTELEAIEKDAPTHLGAGDEDYSSRKQKSTKLIRKGAKIVAIPDLPGCRLDPPWEYVTWQGERKLIKFRFQYSKDTPDIKQHTSVKGRVAFYVGSVLVAETEIRANLSDWEKREPIYATRVRNTTLPYRKIFVAYSHKDAVIVDGLQEAYKALGEEYLRDVAILRSGEIWEEKLLGYIEIADIFQLCWSHSAKASEYVEKEWRHALGLKRDKFIRPIYWEDDWPKPPPELEHIHFAPYNPP